MDFSDGIVVVTGAASGIGAALCRRFAADGAGLVVAVDIDADGAAATASDLGGIGRSRQLDVADEAGLRACIHEIEHDIGPIDVWCSNAGILVAGGTEVPTESWHRILDINVLAHVWAADELVPLFLDRGRGWLLHTASAAGLLSQIGSAPYSVSKHAAVALAEWLAITYGDRGLGVSVLCPQAVDTAMTAGVSGGGVAGVDGMMDPDEVAAVAVAGIRAERFLLLPHPEVATYAQRRATDHDRWITGMQRLAARFPGGGVP